MAAIAGGIIGALVVVGCVAGGLFWYVRKKKRATRDMDVWLDKTSNGEADDEKSMADGSIHPVLSPDFSILLIYSDPEILPSFACIGCHVACFGPNRIQWDPYAKHDDVGLFIKHIALRTISPSNPILLRR